MFEKIRKIYYLFFYKFYCLFISLSKDGWEEWKAYITMNFFGILILVELLVWWTVIFKMIVSIPKYWFAVPVSLLIVFLNYNFFMHNRRWKQYENEFKSYSKRRNYFINFFTILVVAFVLGSLLFSFNKLSKIDWHQYQSH